MANTTLLTIPELQTALRLAGLPPGPQSPFAALSPPSSLEPSVVSSLQAKGVINGNGRPSPPWTGALKTLTTPTHRVAFFLGSADRWFQASYFGSGEGLIGLNQNEEECGVTFPADTSDVEALLGDWLNWSLMGDAGPFTATLLGIELTAFAAIVDAFREESLRAFAERRPGDPSRLSREQITRQLAYADSPDSRWLCPVLKRHAPQAIAPDMQALAAGVRSMASRGLLRFDGDAVTVEGDLYRVCAGMSNIVPYAHLSVEQAGAAGSSALYLTGLKCYWILEFPTGADGQPGFRFQGAGGPAVAAHVRGRLASLPAPRPAASWSEPVTRPEPPPPRATEPIPRPCSQCGKPLKPGRKFCGTCGAPV